MTPSEKTCLGCGCACTGVRLGPDGVAQTPHGPCLLGGDFLASQKPSETQATLAGKPVAVEAALAAAAELLGSATAPLVCGLRSESLEAQRVAVAIADRLGAIVDWTTSTAELAPVLAFQAEGVSTATLGQVAKWADVVCYWDCDPQATHPLHRARFASDVSREGSARKVLRIEPAELGAAGDLEALWQLRAAVRGIPGPKSSALQLLAVQAMADQLRAGKYVAIFYGERLTRSGPAAVAGLHALARELHAHTRCVVLPLGAAGNATGARAVLTWQTGYPAAVSFATGAPRYDPAQWCTAAVLERRSVNAALVVGDGLVTALPPDPARALADLPRVVVAYSGAPELAGAAVGFVVARPGLGASGTVLRCDGVPLWLGDSSPATGAVTILRQLEERLTSSQAAPSAAAAR